MSSSELLRAGEEGNVEFLMEHCRGFINKPAKYLNTDGASSNFLRLAADNNHTDFIITAIEIIPPHIIGGLCNQPDEEGNNLLHSLCADGKLELVNIILEFYKSQDYQSLPTWERPWLATNNDGNTACLIAINFGHEECGRKLWEMDKELLSNVFLKDDGTPIFPHIVFKGYNGWALEMLESNCEIRYIDSTNGFSVFHYVAENSSDKEILKALLKRKPDLLRHRSKEGILVLNRWADLNALWPFECLVEFSKENFNVRQILEDLMSTTDGNGFNPFHILARHDDTSRKQYAVDIAELLMKTCKDILLSNISEANWPWLMQDNQGCTPLHHAINNQNEQFAMCILSENENALEKNSLILATKKGCCKVAEKILNIVERDENWTYLHAQDDDQGVTALHFAPLCGKNVLERLLKRAGLKLLEGADKDGATVLHTWAKISEVWPFECLLRNTDENIPSDMKKIFVKHISDTNTYQNNPLHVAASSTYHDEAAYKISKLLVEAYIQENPTWRYDDQNFSSLPWLRMNGNELGPLHLAIINKHENLALYFLSLFHKPIVELLDYYNSRHKLLFLAVENNCFQLAREILAKLDKGSWSEYVKDPSDGQTIFHLAPRCTDREFVKWLIEEASSDSVTQKNNRDNTPLDEACDVGNAWILRAILQKDLLVYRKAPFAWVKACKNGDISTVRVFIDCYPGKFSYHCIEHQDSPLHHIKLHNLTAYEEFLCIPSMKDVINIQDSQGATPLHKAIQNGNYLLTKTLLKMDNIKYNIKNHQGRTAKDYLAELYKEQPVWKRMCKSIGFDPTIKTAYIQRKDDLLNVRNTLALVAALLATITFTAGFTFPGGFDANTKAATLAKTGGFIIFILIDTLAMCVSMLVLILLVLSMVFDSYKSLVLINYSMKLVLISIYLTLFAFMTGVGLVIPHWVTILVFVMCTSIAIPVVYWSWFYQALDMLLGKANDEDNYGDIEAGTSREETTGLLDPPEESSQGVEVELEEIRNNSS